MARSKKVQAPQGAPDWLVTYGDAMTLLLCFFVILVSMSEIKDDKKFQQVIESLKLTFGGYEGGIKTIPADPNQANTILQKLLELVPKTHTEKPSISSEEGIKGTKYRVTNVREGVEIVIGGAISFEPYSATLLPEARQLLAETSQVVRGYNTIIEVRGHAAKKAWPTDSFYKGPRDLSYERAKSVARELLAGGVREERINLLAMGDARPLRKQAYTKERQAENRRVEILVTEDLVEDLAGTTLADDQKEPTDG
jgi:chemotaxis protein MotB